MARSVKEIGKDIYKVASKAYGMYAEEKRKEAYYRSLAKKYTANDSRMTTSPTKEATRKDVVESRKETEKYLGLQRGVSKKKKKKEL